MVCGGYKQGKIREKYNQAIGKFKVIPEYNIHALNTKKLQNNLLTAIQRNLIIGIHFAVF